MFKRGSAAGARSESIGLIITSRFRIFVFFCLLVLMTKCCGEYGWKVFGYKISGQARQGFDLE